jgi:hypothetical protein
MSISIQRRNRLFRLPNSLIECFMDKLRLLSLNELPVWHMELNPFLVRNCNESSLVLPLLTPRSTTTWAKSCLYHVPSTVFWECCVY